MKLFRMFSALVLLLGLIIPRESLAVEPVRIGLNDVIDSVEQQFKVGKNGLPPLTTVSADFFQRSTIAAQNREMRADGQMFLKLATGSEPLMFRFDYFRPLAQEIICDGRSLWMYQPEKGVFNTLLGSLGIHSPLTYTNEPSTATYWLIVIFIWQYLGFSVIIVQSSFRTNELQEMIEAAIVDGASRLRILFSVILPNIRSGLLVLVSLLLINSLKVFDIVWIVTRGGPGIATDVLATNMIVTAYDQRLFSAGAAIGVIIFLLAFIRGVAAPRRQPPTSWPRRRRAMARSSVSPRSRGRGRRPRSAVSARGSRQPRRPGCGPPGS